MLGLVADGLHGQRGDEEGCGAAGAAVEGRARPEELGAEAGLGDGLGDFDVGGGEVRLLRGLAVGLQSQTEGLVSGDVHPVEAGAEGEGRIRVADGVAETARAVSEGFPDGRGSGCQEFV